MRERTLMAMAEAPFSPRRRLAGSRARRLRASHSYGVVLLLILVVFLVAAVGPEGPFVAGLLLLLCAATLATALWTSGFSRMSAPGGFVLVGAAVVVAAVVSLNGGSRLVGIVGLLIGALIVATIGVVAVGVTDQRSINRQSVQGAICVYLLLGLLFSFLYGAIALLGDGAFFAQGTDGTRALRVYFSFVTLATLGYGDYTPTGDLGHFLAIFEALLGQLYLVTVVALLVSRFGTLRPDPAGSREPPG